MLAYISKVSQFKPEAYLSFIKDLDRNIEDEEPKEMSEEDSNIAFLQAGWAIDPVGLGIVACSDPERLRKSREEVNGG